MRNFDQFMDKYNIELKNINPFIDSVKESVKSQGSIIKFDKKGKIKYEQIINSRQPNDSLSLYQKNLRKAERITQKKKRVLDFDKLMRLAEIRKTPYDEGEP